MKSPISAKKILATLSIVACSAIAQAPVDSAKSMDTAAKAAVHAKKPLKAKTAKPASEPTKSVDSAKVSVPAKGAVAGGAKTCDDLKAKIAANIESKGVKGATLTVVAKDEAGKSGKIVGSCEGGSKRIVYTKG